MPNPFSKRPPVVGAGYLRSSVRPEQLTMVGRWVVVEEVFEESETESGIIVVHQGTQNAVRGRLLRCGPECELDDLAEGDEVLYAEWAGGRNDLGGTRVLIMSLDKILVKVERDGTPD